jgi:hypothetical protein
MRPRIGSKNDVDAFEEIRLDDHLNRPRVSAVPMLTAARFPGSLPAPDRTSWRLPASAQPGSCDT